MKYLLKSNEVVEKNKRKFQEKRTNKKKEEEENNKSERKKKERTQCFIYLQVVTIFSSLSVFVKL